MKMDKTVRALIDSMSLAEMEARLEKTGKDHPTFAGEAGVHFRRVLRKKREAGVHFRWVLRKKRKVAVNRADLEEAIKNGKTRKK